MTSREKILSLISENDGVSAKSLRDSLDISKQRVHVILKELVLNNEIYKVGRPPRVYYHKSENLISEEENFTIEEEAFLESNFLLVDSIGKLLTGKIAFIKWCLQRNLPINKTFTEYVKTLKKYHAFRGENGLIDGTNKLKNTKQLQLCIDQQFYADFYAIERFGKTKLGSLLHFGKLSQSKKLISQIVESTIQDLQKLIIEKKIDAIAYIPPTLPREIQIMQELENSYNISKPTLNLVKVKGEIIIPQKALSKINDRIENAKRSILVQDKRKFKNVLLIDDALGSGATINEVACKLKSKKLATKVFGFAITGSYKGFEVLNEA